MNVEPKLCCVPDCHHVIERKHLMCGYHWFLVPGWLQSQIYKNGPNRDIRKWRELKDRAIEFARGVSA
jgi:hypothetical protein